MIELIVCSSILAFVSFIFYFNKSYKLMIINEKNEKIKFEINILMRNISKYEMEISKIKKINNSTISEDEVARCVKEQVSLQKEIFDLKRQIEEIMPKYKAHQNEREDKVEKRRNDYYSPSSSSSDYNSGNSWNGGGGGFSGGGASGDW